MKLLVGLGNIGSAYENTYHNLGFYIVDAFLDKNNIPKDFKQLKHSHYLKTTFNKQTLIVAKPTTFMNASGKAVLELMQKFKIKKEDVIIVFDDFDMELGKVRYRESGSAGTHNGMRSIVAAIGEGFKRVKMGFGREKNVNLLHLVLKKIPAKEQKIIDESLVEAIEKIEQCLC